MAATEPTASRRDARALDASDVEMGPDGAPVAFRIWRGGNNMTDHGPVNFSPRSAKLLLAEQELRGNLYSIDVDHLSVRGSSAPPEARKAVGWHRLEVRNGDLWAVDVKWTDAVRHGLVAPTPEWRYFSPAYDVDTKTAEVVSYLNTALTNNPATWHVTALATKDSKMPGYVDLMKSMKAMADDAEASDEDRKMAKAALSAIEKMPHDEPDGDEGDDGDDEDDADKKAKKDADDDADEADKKAAADAVAVAASRAKRAATREADAMAGLSARIAELEAERERGERERILATRPDLARVKSMAEYLNDAPLDTVREICLRAPKPASVEAGAAELNAAQKAVRGEGGNVTLDSRGNTRASEHASMLDRRMGFTRDKIGVSYVGRDQILGASVGTEDVKGGK